MVNLLVTYLTLSNEGRRFLRRLRRKSDQADKSLRKKILSDPRRVRSHLHNLIVCDKVFIKQVSSGLCKALGRDRFEIYARFVSYAWLILEIWGRVLDAFEVTYDRPAQERAVVAAFVHREWNDLFDIKKYSFDELFRAIATKDPIANQLILLRQLKQMEIKLAPPERFAKYYEHMRGFYKCSLFEYTKEKAEIILTDVAPYVGLVFMYIMIGDIPEKLKETIKPFSRWMYMLDELADLSDDRLAGRLTYVGMAEDPEESVWKQLRVCEEIILRNAPKPDKLLEFMNELTAKVAQVSKRGVNIEESFFNIH